MPRLAVPLRQQAADEVDEAVGEHLDVHAVEVVQRPPAQLVDDVVLELGPAAAIVKATTFYDDPDVIAKVSRGLGEAMVGINVEDVPEPHRLAERGW